jgi:tRNA G18 (ribose-2'-O)-methylase SpoU
LTIAVIDTGADTRLEDYRNVPDRALLEQRGLFVAEGRLVVTRLLQSALTTRSVMVTPPAYESLKEALAARADVPVFVVSQAVMDGITGFNIHRGCLAIGERPRARSWREVIARPGAAPIEAVARRRNTARCVLVLERVANADNVGGIFRNAAAFGALAVLLDADSTDPFYRKAIRTSMAAALSVPFARAEPWPDMLRELCESGFATIALTPAPGAPALRDCATRLRSQPVALVFGHEGEGLTPAALDACEYQARIPIAPGVDSLNVASAAAIALYELC